MPEAYGAGTYDAVYLLVAAIRDVGTDPAKLQSYMEQLGKAKPAFEGVKGLYQFNDKHDPVMSTIFVQVKAKTWILAPDQNS